MSNKKNDRKLRKLLATLLAHIEKYGSRSDKVKKFVQKNEKVKEFVELAVAAIVIFEKHRKKLKRS